jgi:hypothetical protein
VPKRILMSAGILTPKPFSMNLIRFHVMLLPLLLLVAVASADYTEEMSKCKKGLEEAKQNYIRAASYDPALKHQLSNIGQTTFAMGSLFAGKIPTDELIKKTNQINAGIREEIAWEEARLKPVMGTESGTLRRVEINPNSGTKLHVKFRVEQLRNRLKMFQAVSNRASELARQGVKTIDVDEMIRKVAWTAEDGKVKPADLIAEIIEEERPLLREAEEIRASIRENPRRSDLLAKDRRLKEITGELNSFSKSKDQIRSARDGLANIFEDTAKHPEARAYLRERLISRTALFENEVAQVERQAASLGKAAAKEAGQNFTRRIFKGMGGGGTALGLFTTILFIDEIAEELHADELDDAWEAMLINPNSLFSAMNERGSVSFTKVCEVTRGNPAFRQMLEDSLYSLNLATMEQGLTPAIFDLPTPIPSHQSLNPAGSTRRGSTGAW